MSIEWGGYVPGLSSEMSHGVVDNTLAPTKVLTMTPFTVKVSWDVPLNVAMGINALHTFRLRMFAESIGPRPDRVLISAAGFGFAAGQNQFVVPGAVGQQHYDVNVSIEKTSGQAPCARTRLFRKWRFDAGPI